ncbi:MAG: hypothetical protein ACXQTN_04095 [Methanoculleaceae archaeon]
MVGDQCGRPAVTSKLLTDDITVEFQPDHTGHIPCHGAYPGGLIARYGLTDHLFEMLRLPIIRGETRNPDRRWGRPS